MNARVCLISTRIVLMYECPLPFGLFEGGVKGREEEEEEEEGKVCSS